MQVQVQVMSCLVFEDIFLSYLFVSGYAVGDVIGSGARAGFKPNPTITLVVIACLTNRMLSILFMLNVKVIASAITC